MKLITFVLLLIAISCTGLKNPMEPEEEKAVTPSSAVSVSSGGGSGGVSTPSVPVESVTLNKNVTEIIVGDGEKLVVTVNPENASDKSVTWSSDNVSVATVTNGIVYPIKNGTATITVKASSDTSKIASCTVTVKQITLFSTSFTNNGEIPNRCGGSNNSMANLINIDHECRSPQFSWYTDD